ncbi:MAG: recombinase family protein [Pseudomonadota bacterium]
MNNEPKPQAAVVYARVSSDRQIREGHGLDSQESRCREYAAIKGYSVEEVFQDKGVSGGLIDRPGMRAMLDWLADQPEETVVIIDDISRLARDIEAHLQLRGAIASAGARLESPTTEFGDDADSRLVENLLASVSQHHRQKNTEQVKNRMRARMLAGYWLFSPAIGYRYEKVPGHGKLLVRDEPNASTIAAALEGYATGRFKSIAEVKRFLESDPTIPRQRSGEVHFDTVRGMLERPLYAGYITFENWGIHLQPARHEPLISFETWTRIQHRLKGRPVAPARADTSAEFPLRGFVACASCGSPMTAAKSTGRSRRYAYYHCYKRGCPECRKSIPAAKIERDFEALLADLRPARQLVDMLEAILRDLWDARLAKSGEQAKQAKTQLAVIGKKTAKLMDRLMETDSPELIAAYEGQIKTLAEETARLREIAATKARPLVGFDTCVRTALSFLANPLKLWHSERPEDRRIVLRLAFGDRLSYCRHEGYSNPNLTFPFKALGGCSAERSGLVEPRGVEPLTS